MKYLLLTIGTLAMAATFWMPVEAIVRPTADIADIIPEIDEETLVLFDIDDTTMVSTHMLGSSPWWNYFMAKIAGEKFDQSSKQYWYSVVNHVMQNIPQRPVDNRIPEIIRSLQNRGITVWGLTGRYKKAPFDAHFGCTTHSQLSAIHVDFSRSSIPEGCDLALKPQQFAHGTIFTDFKLKGPVLMDFLGQTGFRPAKVVMVEDLEYHLESIQKELTDAGIENVCFHYTHANSSTAPFDPLIANIQLKALVEENRLLSDDEARFLKNNEQDPDFYLNYLIFSLKNFQPPTLGAIHGSTR